MDIAHPTAPALPHKDVGTGQAAIDNAENNLSNFKAVCKRLTKEAKDLRGAAKDLVKEERELRELGHKNITSGEWTKEIFDMRRQGLTAKQSKPWEFLEAKADKVRAELDKQYKLVVDSKDNCSRARGDGVSGAWGGFATQDQKHVRRVFDHKLKAQFQEAAVAYDSLAAYPDGLLTQVTLLQKKSLEDLKVNQHQNLYLAAK